MIELGQLDRHHEEFARRNVRVMAISVEGMKQARETQAECPHLTIVADEQHGLSDAAGLIHPETGPRGSDTSAPTTIIIDRHGTVRWLFRSNAVNVRLSPEEVLQAIDTSLARGAP